METVWPPSPVQYGLVDPALRTKLRVEERPAPATQSQSEADIRRGDPCSADEEEQLQMQQGAHAARTHRRRLYYAGLPNCPTSLL